MNSFVLYLSDGKTKKVAAEAWQHVGHALEFSIQDEVVFSIADRLVIVIGSAGIFPTSADLSTASVRRAEEFTPRPDPEGSTACEQSAGGGVRKFADGGAARS